MLLCGRINAREQMIAAICPFTCVSTILYKLKEIQELEGFLGVEGKEVNRNHISVAAICVAFYLLYNHCCHIGGSRENLVLKSGLVTELAQTLVWIERQKRLFSQRQNPSSISHQSCWFHRLCRTLSFSCSQRYNFIFLRILILKWGRFVVMPSSEETWFPSLWKRENLI